jgi:hypothetical protein
VAQDSCVLALNLETVAHRYANDMLHTYDQELHTDYLNHRLAGVVPEPSIAAKAVKLDSVSAVSMSPRAAVAHRLPQQLNQQRSRAMLPAEEPAE